MPTVTFQNTLKGFDNNFQSSEHKKTKNMKRNFMLLHMEYFQLKLNQIQLTVGGNGDKFGMTLFGNHKVFHIVSHT